MTKQTLIVDVEREIDEISRTRDYTRRLSQPSDGPLCSIVSAINTLLGEVDCRERELKQRLDELVDARDDAQTASLLLRRVKDELKSRTLQLDKALSRAAAASSAKSQFLANMSHEIRTPMNGILGMAELLSRTNLEARQRQFVGTIVQSGRALLTIINDILDFSKIESGRLEIDAKPFDIKMCIADVAALLSPGADRKGIKLVTEIDQALPNMYVGDAGRIRQVLTNIVGNAVKFTDTGGVTIRLTGEVAGQRAGLKVEIIDTGIGIPPGKLKEVFDQFSQVDGTSTRGREGTGLGLAICKLLVERMGGTIGLTSTLGSGTTFWFTLALPVHRQAASPLASGNGIVLRGRRILLVQPYELDGPSLPKELESLGCEIELANERTSRTSQWFAHAMATSDLVLLNVNTVDESLLNQIRELRARNMSSSVPILVLTTIGAQGDAKAAADAGAQAYLAGAISRSELRQAIETAIAYASARVANFVTRHSLAEDRKAAAPSPSPVALEPATPERSGAKATPQPATAPTPSKDAAPPAAPEATPATAAPAAASAAGSAQSRKHKVLVVEDSLVNQEVAREFLEAIDCDVVMVMNGQEAVAATSESKFDIVLMDCQMPIMDGFTATRKIRDREKAEKARPMPIIALTAGAFASDRQKCLDSGMSDFLSKPFVPEEFEAIVKKWLEESRVGLLQASAA